MQYIPIKTRIMQPPQDDLFAMLDEYLTEVKEQDVVLISSKVVAIGEGRCVSVEGTDKATIVSREADLLIPRDYWSSPLTVVHSAFIGTAGVDESNANGHYVLLPKEPFKSAAAIHDYLAKKFSLTDLGVVIVDSHSSPLRRGATGISIGWWGFEPVVSCVGEKDLFGRELQIEVSNIVDGLAAGANVVMGETDECLPIVIARDVPRLIFTVEDTKHKGMVSFAEDTYRVLYERFLK